MAESFRMNSRDPARRSDESQPHENPFQPRDEPQSQYQNEEEEEEDSGGKGSEDELQRERTGTHEMAEEIAKLKESKKKAEKPLPPSQEVNEPFKCNLINHNGNNDVVAIGYCYPSRVFLHNVPLKPGEVAVTVSEVKIDIHLWAPVDDIEMLRNAIDAFIAWPKEMVVHYERVNNREEEKSEEQIEKNASENASKKDEANERNSNQRSYSGNGREWMRTNGN
ncbi:unnamed protein product [Arabis nemorensis]|uniref:DUF8039 domain-containing protein n=1 Tax=Arabis nemorensis TaxID=586526 RepID=A0A565BMD4_9BRAS|nr:unnamed protein product [Arabis nemorensis]